MVKKSQPNAKNLLEQWIWNSLKNGELKPFDKLPPEKIIKQKYNVSKQTVTKTIAKFVNIGILMSFQGKGVFVSPLWDKTATEFKFIPIKDGVVARRKDQVFKSNNILHPMPNEIARNIYGGYKKEDWGVFIKYFYNDKNVVVAYSINWINKNISEVSVQFFEKNPTIAFEDIFKLCLVENKIVTLAANPEDKQIFQDEKMNFIPTSFSYLFESNIIPVMVRMVKVKSEFFVVDHKIVKTKFMSSLGMDEEVEES